jgi:geranylgeranyl pyrophosphate synthase
MTDDERQVMAKAHIAFGKAQAILVSDWPIFKNLLL